MTDVTGIDQIMKKVNIIVAVAQNGVIGDRKQQMKSPEESFLPWPSLKTDFQWLHTIVARSPEGRESEMLNLNYSPNNVNTL